MRPLKSCFDDVRAHAPRAALTFSIFAVVASVASYHSSQQEEEVRSISQSILLGCMQQALLSLHAHCDAPALGQVSPCASRPCEAASMGGGRDVDSVEGGGGEFGTMLSMKGGDDMGEEERRECRRQQERMLKAMEKAVHLAVQAASSQAASSDPVRRPLQACSSDATAREASRRGFSLIHLIRSLVPASPIGQVAAESSGQGRGMHGDSGGVLPRTGVESDSGGGSGVDAEESSSAAAKLLAVAASLRESTGSPYRHSPVRGFVAAHQGPTSPGTPGVAVRVAFADAPLYEDSESLRKGREQPGVVEENPGWALGQIVHNHRTYRDEAVPGHPDRSDRLTSVGLLVAAAVPGSPDSTRGTPHAGRNGTWGGGDKSSPTHDGILVHQRLV